MFQQLGPLEVGLIVLLVLIIFGAGKLPQVGSALGKSIKEFRKAREGEDEDADEPTETKSTKKTSKAKEGKTG